MLHFKLQKIARLLWVVPALLLWASFPPRGEYVDVLFALAPLLWVSRQGRGGGFHGAKMAPTAVGGGALWFGVGFVYYFATLSWMPAIIKNNGPWPLVVLGWGALAAYCALYFAAFGFLIGRYWDWARDRGYGWRLVGAWIMEPVLWAGLELIRSRFGGGFAWNQLGVVAVNAGFGAPAALGGVYLLSMGIILINGMMCSLVERMFRRGGTALETVVPIVVIWGVFQVSGMAPTTEGGGALGGALKVALVQRNFPCVFKAEEMERDPLGVYSNLVSHLEYLRPDLVVLPESALCEFGRVDGYNARAFADRLRAWTGAKAVVAGGSRRDGGRVYNSAGLYDEKGLAGVYDKVHLVPFGEYIPGDKWFTWLQKLAPVESCTPGEQKLLGDFGVAICYEDTDSALMRAAADKGARALLFITNDSWFSKSVEPWQHAWQAVARAIETGLPVVRVGNSGVTGFISPNGKAAWLVDEHGKPLMDEAGTLFDQIELATPGTVTWYRRLGDMPLFLAFLICIFAQIMVKYIDIIVDLRRKKEYGID